jgi:hypothetical protein
VVAKRDSGRYVNFRDWLHPLSGDMHVAEALAISEGGRPWGRNRLRLFHLASARFFAKSAVLRGLRRCAPDRLLPRRNSVVQRSRRIVRFGFLRSAMRYLDVRPRLLVTSYLISPLQQLLARKKAFLLSSGGLVVPGVISSGPRCRHAVTNRRRYPGISVSFSYMCAISSFVVM